MPVDPWSVYWTKVSAAAIELKESFVCVEGVGGWGASTNLMGSEVLVTGICSEPEARTALLRKILRTQLGPA